jgi:hypothetical protein
MRAGSATGGSLSREVEVMDGSQGVITTTSREGDEIVGDAALITASSRD